MRTMDKHQWYLRNDGQWTCSHLTMSYIPACFCLLNCKMLSSLYCQQSPSLFSYKLIFYRRLASFCPYQKKKKKHNMLTCHAKTKQCKVLQIIHSIQNKVHITTLFKIINNTYIFLLLSVTWRMESSDPPSQLKVFCSTLDILVSPAAAVHHHLCAVG